MLKYLFICRNFIFLLLVTMFLTACGGGSGGGQVNLGGGTDEPAAGLTVTGTATAPGGTVASLQDNHTYFDLAFDYVIRPGYAAIIGLQPVTGATVELIRIDDDGNQVGDVLASTTTSLDGSYDLQLPSGIELSPDLVVRISGTGVSMAAMVVEEAVDINPISQFVLDKFVEDDTLTLADLPINQIVALRGRIEEFDFTAEADLTAMLDRLERDLGDLAETEIVEIKKTPDDGTATTAAAGTWNLVEFDIGLFDNERQDFGTLGVDVSSFSLLIEAGSATGTLSISEGETLIDSITNLSVDNTDNQNFANIFNEISLTGEDDSFEATIDAAGNITVLQPFEEDLQTVDVGDEFTDPENDGPDFGFRFPPLTRILSNIGGNDNTLISTSRETGVRFETIDTNNDGIKDAVNPDAKDGDEAIVDFVMLLKGGDGMSEASLEGYYGFVSFFAELANFGSAITTFSSTVGKAHFDGLGEASVPPDGLDEIGFQRLPIAINDVAIEVFDGVEGDFGVPYSVSSTGGVVLETEEVLEGWSNNDGSLFALVDATPIGGEAIETVFNEIMVGIKLAEETQPQLNGAEFRLFSLIFGASEDGTTEVLTFGRNSTLSFDDSAAVVTTDLTLRGFERSTDVAEVRGLRDEQGPLQFEVGSIDGMGKITFSNSDEISTTNVKGFVSADGNLMVLRVYRVEETVDPTTEFTNHFHDLGIIIAVRQ